MPTSLNIKKITVDVKQNTEKNIHSYEYLVSGETFGTNTQPQLFARRLEPSTPVFIPYGAPYLPRRESLFFLFEGQINPANKYFLPQVDIPGPDIINFNNYIQTDLLEIFFSYIDGRPPEKKGGVVIRDSNYPPPSSESISKFTESFDQVSLSCDFKVKKVEMERTDPASLIFNVNIILSVVNASKKYKYNGFSLVQDTTINDSQVLVLFISEDSMGDNDTVNCPGISVDFSVTKIKHPGLAILIWYGMPVSNIDWQYSMRKKGMIWIA